MPINLPSPKPTLAPPRASRSEDGPGGLAGEAAGGAGSKGGRPDIFRGDAHVKEFKDAEFSGAWDPSESLQDLGDGLPPITGVGQGNLRGG